jgi:hypothetical protein
MLPNEQRRRLATRHAQCGFRPLWRVQRRELQSSRLNEPQRVNYERSGRALADSNRVPATPAAT